MQQQQQQQTNYANVSSPGMSVDPTIHDQYSYVDVNGVIQGPFQFFQIQEWIQQGHFKPSVHLRQGNVGIFQDLSMLGLMLYKEDPNTESGRLERSLPYLEKNWYYIDRSGVQQGPFTYNIMYDWVVQGQLTPEIVARCGEVGPFTPIIKTAFMGVVPSVTMQQHPQSPLMPAIMQHPQPQQHVVLPVSHSNNMVSANNNTADNNTNNNDINRQLSELRNILNAKESELNEIITKLHSAQEKVNKERADNVQLKRGMEKLEEQSRANIAKIETLTIENQKMKRDKMAIKKQLEEQESKQKGSMKAYEKAFCSISNIIEQCKKDSIGSKSLYSSDKAPSSTSTTSGDLSSTSWANAAENEDNDNDTDDSIEEERILLSPSGVKVKQSNCMKQRNIHNNATPQQQHRYRPRRNSKDNKKANASLPNEKQSDTNNNTKREKKLDTTKAATSTTTTRGISSILPGVTPSTASKSHKRRNKNKNKSGESKPSATTGKQNGSDNNSAGPSKSVTKSKSKGKGRGNKSNNKSTSKSTSVQSN